MADSNNDDSNDLSKKRLKTIIKEGYKQMGASSTNEILSCEQAIAKMANVDVNMLKPCLAKGISIYGNAIWVAQNGAVDLLKEAEKYERRSRRFGFLPF